MGRKTKVRETEEMAAAPVVESARQREMKEDLAAAAGAEVPRVEVVTPQETALGDMGADILRSMVAVGEKYVSMCRYIRQEQIMPAVVTRVLERAGFAKSRISEINRVAGASEDAWNEYEARRISFKDVLRLERGTPVMNELYAEAAERGDADKLDVVVEDAKPVPPPTGRQKLEQKRVALNRAAKTILVAIGKMSEGGLSKCYPKEGWNFGNGWVLTLTRDESFQDGTQNE